MTHREKDALIERLQKENAELKARLTKLELLLGMNSRNSSNPPSSDPPNTAKESAPKKRKKRGAKKGHEAHLKEMLPPDKVNRSRVIEPEACPDCDGEHFVESSEEPLHDEVHQVRWLGSGAPPSRRSETVMAVLRCRYSPCFVYELARLSGVERGHYVHAGQLQDPIAADLYGGGGAEDLLTGTPHSLQLAAFVFL